MLTILSPFFQMKKFGGGFSFFFLSLLSEDLHLQISLYLQIFLRKVIKAMASRTSNYRYPVCKFAKFPITEQIKQKTPSPAKMLIECNSVTLLIITSNSINYMFVKS